MDRITVTTMATCDAIDDSDDTLHVELTPSGSYGLEVRMDVYARNSDPAYKLLSQMLKDTPATITIAFTPPTQRTPVER